MNAPGLQEVEEPESVLQEVEEPAESPMKIKMANLKTAEQREAVNDKIGCFNYAPFPEGYTEKTRAKKEV